MRQYLLFLSIFFLFSFSETSLKKRISDVNFRYEFYTTDKEVDPKPERQYYWFKGGSIHYSEYGLAGELLHKEYLKFYHSNQLAEAGKYNNGLKVGLWKTWFENGALQSKVSWSRGQKDGVYYAYDETGILVEHGKYKDNKKHGRWINYISKDTLKYKEGKVVSKKVNIKDTIQNNKPGFFKRLFTKKDKTVGTNPETKDLNKTAPTEKAKQDNFFKRLFSKKDKTQNKETAVKQTQIKPVAENETKGNFFTRLFSKKEKKPKN